MVRTTDGQYGSIGHKIGLCVIPDGHKCHSRAVGVSAHFSGLAVSVSR
jgi:hypothetical protein